MCMNPQSTEPFGKALLAYFEGDEGARLIVRRDDGIEAPLPASHFFREESSFTGIEKKALALCRGRVLDVGAGSGLHSLALQVKGYEVTSLDISPDAVNVMKRRGLKDVRCAEVFSFHGGQFDTLLLLGHGIGMVETVDGLTRFLGSAGDLLSDGGCVILDSLDVRATDDPANLAYHEMNRNAGRYIGEIRMLFEFRGVAGPFCGWLQVDAGELAKHAGAAGWRCEIMHKERTGDYLARLSKAG